jgi:DNA mismatch repair protein MutS
MSTGTPLMQQYRDIKSRHQDAILLFRMGDFYEMFYEDAEIAARALGLTLTSRNNGAAADVPLAGVPVKAVAEYMRRLVQQGHRVAVCEQVEDPKLAKGIVKREVVETVTPGAVFADDLLDDKRANYVVAVCAAPVTSGSVSTPATHRERRIGIAAADLSTGELRVTTVAAADAAAHLARLSPREILTPRPAAIASVPPGHGSAPHDAIAALLQAHQRVHGAAFMTEREPWEFDGAVAHDELTRQFRIASLEGLGLSSDDPAVGALGALVRYLRELQPAGLPHLVRPIVEPSGTMMPLDDMTRRNLELVESLRGGTEGTLLSVMDTTVTPMGGRLLRHWMLSPLVDRTAIDARLHAVHALVHAPVERARLRDALDGVRDIERLASKTAAARCTPRELRALGDSLARLPQVAQATRDVVDGIPRTHSAGVLGELLSAWDTLDDLAQLICTQLVERPPLQIGDEPSIATGVDHDLDAMRLLRDGGRDAIAAIQAAERERTGIASLKVGYNRVFGYFIEISNANKHLVPSDYQRRQTLTGAERYVTPALKEYEERVLGASERIEQRERELFEALRRHVGAQVGRLLSTAHRTATLDVLATLADVAEREQYVCPEFHDAFVLHIEGGRHPVVERMMPREQFIPNDLSLTESARLMILTGPNMAGKSTILRQVGLIQLMAQIGSFVPARSATLPVVDRLFTRVGASDNLVRGQSTFMVEMSETSAILHTATNRSLVLLDEIGRGTATYDGVSIAWSVSEHLHDVIGCKTVFATHYHELTQLAEERTSVCNFTVAVREVGDDILFLHRLIPGGADRSYGIEVGRLAGLPDRVIARAKQVLAQLEGDGAQLAERVNATAELPLFAATAHQSPSHFVSPSAPGAAVAGNPESHIRARAEQVAEQLRAVDPNHLTPLDALQLIARLKTHLTAE